MISIENEGILIRELKEQDINALTDMRNDKRVYCYEPIFLTELQGTPEESMKAIHDMDLIIDRQCILGIYEADNPGILIGLAEFYDYKTMGKVISIGYRLRSEYWGRGIGCRCVSAMLNYIKEHTDVLLVTAHVIPENRASAKCLLKNGFE